MRKFKAKHPTKIKLRSTDSTQLKPEEFIDILPGDYIVTEHPIRKEDGHLLVYIKAYVYGPHWEEIKKEEDEEEKNLDSPIIIDRTITDRYFHRRLTDEEFKDINRCLNLYSINTNQRLAHFLSQAHHESGGLKWLREIWGPTVTQRGYEYRRDLGNVQKGDGFRFRGAGVLQMTGRWNYQRFADYIKDPFILVKGCDYVADNYPFSSAGHWWKANGMNDLVDSGASVEQVTRKVNGGITGLKDRQNQYDRIVKLLKERKDVRK